jgi:hypothetical protein
MFGQEGIGFPGQERKQSAWAILRYGMREREDDTLADREEAGQRTTLDGPQGQFGETGIP